MINKWIEFNEALKRGEKINAKISLLKDLALELTDIGLSVDIESGSFNEIKSIVMFIKDENSVLDDNNYYENVLWHKKEILDFEKTLKSFKMSPRAKTGNGQDGVIFLFDKQGPMTSGGDVLKDYL